MTPARRWLAGLGLAVGACALLGAVLLSLVPSDAVLAQRLAAALGDASGVNVSVGAVHWHLRPWPVVVVEDLATDQAHPVSFKKLSLYPDISALWQRRIKLDLAELEGAVVPQKSMRGLGGSAKAARSGKAIGADVRPEGAGWTLDELPLSRFVFRDVSWISRSGVAVVYDGQADFDTGWRPRTAQLRRPGAKAATDLSLSRQGQQDRWDVLLNAGGGTGHGELQVQTLPNGRLHLAGKLQPKGIEVASALQAFNRRPVISGQASGTTTLSADGLNAVELMQSLHTQTVFTMGPSTLLRFDLDKAVRSLGKAHDGQTRLDSVTGQLDTQNTAEGMVIDFTRIKATSGALSASGKARLMNRQIDAEVAVDLVDGVVGLPLKISGPLDKVTVSAPPGAVAGAVVGTAVLPGVGTAIGARLGAAVSRMFGSAPARDTAATPAPLGR
jgi:AsmA-like C-terminal region